MRRRVHSEELKSNAFSSLESIKTWHAICWLPTIGTEIPFREIEIDPYVISGTSNDWDVIVLLPELDCLYITIEVFEENKGVDRTLFI